MTNKLARSASRSALACAILSSLALAGCQEGGDPTTQIGANPVLPEPQQYLLPPMHVASVEKWTKDQTPAVPQGMQVRALARDLVHPRSVYVLPNGDVLVAESSGPPAPINRPKDLIMGLGAVLRRRGEPRAPTASRCCATSAPTGCAKTRTVFLDHLASPFGVALVGHDLYVADTDAILTLPLYRWRDAASRRPASS